MPILHKLRDLYRQRGHEIVFGLRQQFTGLENSEAAHIITADRQITQHLGIYPAEVYFLEHLLSEFRPQRIFVIGNSFGWSTFALAMLAPQARVLAIEAGAEPFTQHWIGETNSIAAEAGLNVRVEKGISPVDVDRIAPLAGGKFDFVFVDGMHTSKQAVHDYAAAARHSHDETIYLFHDVILFDMLAGIDEICRSSGIDRHILWRTSTGMALLCRNAHHANLLPLIDAFELNDLAVEMIRWMQTRKQEQRKQQPTPPK